MKPRAQTLPATLIMHLTWTALIVLAPMAFFQPIAISVLGMMLLAWRALVGWRSVRVPERTGLLLAALLCMLLVYVSHHQLLGKLPGLSLLTLLMPLKLLEARDTRDARAAVMLGLFLQIGLFTLAQSGWVATWVLLDTALLLAAMARIQSPHRDTRRALRLSLVLLGQALPLMLLLFVLFPRVDGPLWGLPLDAYGGRTGLSDSMSPGSISQLAESGDIAFRVEFEGAPPPPALRYWRGPVLTEFDGEVWLPQPGRFMPALPFTPSGRAYRYTMTLEPHDQRWLLALDYPQAVGDQRFSHDFSLLSRTPVRFRSRYTVTSWPDVQVGRDENRYVLATALRLPPRRNPRTLALGQRIAAEHAEPVQRVAAALAAMRGAHLLYTLYPPLLGENSVDEFLFDSKRGFCEHFAAAFVVLMRAAGVPARVVTGYQGGEINPVDHTLVVRQSDAHAWAEVWLADRGWTRVDPTAATFPERIDGGMVRALPRGEALPFALREDVAWLNALRFRWEALGNAWNQWVLGYNARKQTELMQRVGLPDTDWRSLGLLLAASAGLWLAWLAWQYRPQRRRMDALDRAWRTLCRRLARRGGARHDWEAPTDYARRMGIRFPGIAHELVALAERYAAMRYGPRPPQAEDVRMLARDLRRLPIR